MITPGIDICLHAAQIPSTEDAGSLFSEALHIPANNDKHGRMDRFIRSEFLHLAQVRSDRGRRVELDLRVTALIARLLQLNSETARENPKTSPENHVGRAREFICENYAKITCAGEIARHVGVSQDYLRHLFIEHGGTSLNRLLNQTKIERVKELLIHSQLPLKEISSLSGFKTERYLSTRFKQLVGIGPGVFRRQSQQAMREQMVP